MRAKSLLSAAVGSVAVNALNNGLGRVPQMGYNSWYDVLMNPSDDLTRATAQAMVDTGLAAAGYKYVNLDDGVWATSRDANGNLATDPTTFPNGLKAVADYVHSQGLLFGVYTDRGTETCGGRPGALGHEFQDAAWYASQDVDYLKEDSCYASTDHQTAFTEYSTMRDGLNATGRSMFFSLCGWEQWYAPVGHAIGNSWRTGPDDSNWEGVLTDIDDLANLYIYAGPGGWNDPCLLLGRDMHGNQDVTDLQGRAQFSMWAIVAAPMLLSSNVRNLTSYQLETYLNPEVIAVGQDPLGRAGQRLAGSTVSLTRTHKGASAPRTSNDPFKSKRIGGKKQHELAANVSSGSNDIPITLQACSTGIDGTAVTTQQWVYNTPAAGYYQNTASTMCMNLDDCGSDIIAFQCVTSGGTCCGPDCYQNLQWQLSEVDGSLTSPLVPGQCVTADGQGAQVSLMPCIAGSPGQTWSYDEPTQMMQLADGGGCLTVGGGNQTRSAIWGRPQADGSWAIAMINADSNPLNMTCDWQCLAATGWETEQTLTVRDLWARADLPMTNVSVGISVSNLPADGGIAMFKLTPYWNTTQ